MSKVVETQPDYDLGPFIEAHYALLRYVLQLKPRGVALEFGVGQGTSLLQIADYMPVFGFDSFKGLPEDWRDGFSAGAFACNPPYVPCDRCSLVIGLFEDTLPDFDFDDIGLVHIDCDLYSSTATVLKYVGPHLNSGCYVVFDEWHGYPGCERDEQRAWREFAKRSGIRWNVVGHSFQQWAIRIK